MGQTAVIPAQIVDVAARSLLGNNTASADAAQTISFSAASSGDVLTVQGDGSVAFAAPAGGGIGGSTGSTDNAVLRTDGTGGATLQASGWIIADNYTASPNATVNHASLQATGSTTNVSVSIVPKGTGAFCLAVPDGTATGGNVRGANAIDLQTLRDAATQVASSANSVAIGVRSTASSTSGVAIGNTAAATGPSNGQAIAIGFQATASGNYSVAIGRGTASNTGAIVICSEAGTASGTASLAIGTADPAATGGSSIAIGGSAKASRTNEIAWGFRHNLFDLRPGAFLLSCKTTNNTFTALAGNNLFESGIAWTTRSGTLIQGVLQVLGTQSDGSAVASYTRKVIFKNVGGTITLVQSETIGTDYEDNASTDIEISNTSPFFRVKGINGETWRWAGWFGPTIELAYGT